MKKKTFILLLLSMFYITTKAQPGKEAWHWQFGDGVALDFSSGAPVVGSSAIFQFEGSASVSDPNTGQLLFYTDGISAWDKNNNVMPNGFGLLGDMSSTQSALIVPKPGSNTLFYIITTPAFGGAYGGVTSAYYSVVDMTLNGGLGDIVTSSKNTILTTGPVTEKLTAVKQCNGASYWIIDHPFNTNQFNAYLLTASGISATPVISNIGTMQSGSNEYNAVGYLKASPNGKKLAQGIDAMGILEIFDFNASTGVVSNPIIINYPTSSFGGIYQGPYGLSFSPDNTKLYTCYENQGSIYQWDLSSGVASTIMTSQVAIGTSSSAGALALGPDGKLYKAEYSFYALSVINNPNQLGIACNFQSQSISLLGECQFGLPNFIDANGSGSIINISNAVQCNTFTADTLNAGPGFTSYQWSTGASTQTIAINSPGTYWVTVGNSTGCTITDTIKAYTINPSSVHILRDTTICSSSGSYVANATYSGAQSYLWYDGSTNPIKTINASGTYSVSIYFSGGCVVHNSFNLILNTKPKVNIGNDTVVCHSITNPITLNAGAGSSYTYQWSTGASTQVISVNSGGTYWVKVNSATGCSTIDTINILVVGSSMYNVHDTSLCSASQFPILLTPPAVPGTNNYYYWSDGNIGHSDYTYYPGSIILDIYINGGSCIITDIFNVVLDTARPHINDVTFCNSFTSFTVSAGSYAYYLWSTGASTSSITVNNPGTYWVKVTSSSGCISVDTFSVSVINPANVHVLKDTMVCEPNYYYNYYANAYVAGAQSYVWYDGYTTTPGHYFYSTGFYWVDIHFAGGCVVKDSFLLILNQAPSVYLGNDQAICGSLSAPIVLNGGYFSSYQWSTGATTQSISVNTSGVYFETVTAANGCKAKDSIDIQIYPYGNTYHDTDIVICSVNPFPIVLHANVPNSYYNYYYWNGGYGGYTNSVYNSGTYYVQVDINGGTNCIVIDTFHVSTGSILKPVIPDRIQCNTSVPDLLDAGSGYTNYYWSTGATTQSINVNTSGNYMVTVTNNQGCKITDTVKVGYYNSPQINVLKDTFICGSQSSVIYNAIYPGATAYLWSDGFTYPIHTINTAGNYVVTYTLNTTCTATDSFTVGLKTFKYIDALPNIVTPNNDGKNDFIDFSVYQFPTLQLDIYDRWGTKIFESIDPNCIWKPTCDDGTYFYVAAYTADCDPNQKIKTLKGFFTVLK